MWGVFFFLGAQKLPGEEGGASLRLRVVDLPFPTVLSPYAPFWCRYRPNVFSLTRQAHPSKHRAPVRTSYGPSPPQLPPPPSCTQRPVSAIPNSFPESFFLRTECRIHISYPPRRLPLGGFPPLWLDQSWPSMRLSMTPQRLGKSQISLSLGLVSGYGIAVAPYCG
jgi:hypothetical protein